MGITIGKDKKRRKDHNYDFDLFVIGGGSGGISVAREAGRLGARVGLSDYVIPSGKGNVWGLGGTCVNVGCIPKKLMHIAAKLGQDTIDASTFGWNAPDQDNLQTNWKELTAAIDGHIKSLNWGYKVVLHNSRVKYFNSYASFLDPHTIEMTDKDGKTTTKTAYHIVVATGGRPKYLNIPGAGKEELVVTSDDIFSLPYPPGKTLCIGGSYVALECASFLAGLKMEVAVMVREQILSGRDRQMASMIKSAMEERGVAFHMGFTPTQINKLEDGTPPLIQVTAENKKDGQIIKEKYNTVLVAIGRSPCTSDFGLENVGVLLNKDTKKIITNKADRTNINHIYAIGDVADTRPELTPPAIKAGILLARRLFGASKMLMDYDKIPTTIFTIPEYSFIGFAEEEAISRFGSKNIEVYHAYFNPLQESLTSRWSNECYLKLICVKSEKEKVVGFHYFGPEAGEVCQGFALAMRLGATKKDFDAVTGIHPTNAEIFTTLTYTKSSGGTAEHTAC